MVRRTLHAALFCATLAFAAGAGLMAIPTQAHAQSENRALSDRLDRIERDMNSMQRQVYRGGPNGSGTTVIASPQSGGPGTMSAEGAGDMLSRISGLEDQLRQLTGQVEELQFKNGQLKQQVERALADNELRFKEMEQKLAPAAPPVAAVAPPGAPLLTPPGQAPVLTPPAGAAVAESKAGQAQTLGALSGADLKKAGAAAKPGISPQEQYEQAFGYIRDQDYVSAEKALTGFIAANPSDPLAGNAQYWLGETYYARQDFQKAAVAFVEAYKQYPKNPKAPDSLLKLGLSLDHLGKKKEACAAFGRLGVEFPNAPDTIKRKAASEKQKAACP